MSAKSSSDRAAAVITRAARAYAMRRIASRGASKHKDAPSDCLSSSSCSFNVGISGVGANFTTGWRRLFVGHVSRCTTPSDFYDHFAQFGAVEDSLIVVDRATGKPRGFGFVTFADAKVAETVLAHMHTLDSCVLNVKVARALAPDDASATTTATTTDETATPPLAVRKLFVGGLAQAVTPHDFQAYFSTFGTLEDSVVMFDRHSGRSRGFGFVTFSSEDASRRALAQPHAIHGKAVDVKLAEPKEACFFAEQQQPRAHAPHGKGRGARFPEPTATTMPAAEWWQEKWPAHVPYAVPVPAPAVAVPAPAMPLPAGLPVVSMPLLAGPLGVSPGPMPMYSSGYSPVDATGMPLVILPPSYFAPMATPMAVPFMYQ